MPLAKKFFITLTGTIILSTTLIGCSTNSETTNPPTTSTSPEQTLALTLETRVESHTQPEWSTNVEDFLTNDGWEVTDTKTLAAQENVTVPQTYAATKDTCQIQLGSSLKVDGLKNEPTSYLTYKHLFGLFSPPNAEYDTIAIDTITMNDTEKLELATVTYSKNNIVGTTPTEPGIRPEAIVEGTLTGIASARTFTTLLPNPYSEDSELTMPIATITYECLDAAPDGEFYANLLEEVALHVTTTPME